MGLLSKVPKPTDRFLRRALPEARTCDVSRICRFEQMETRRLLAISFAPIQIGSVYFEDGSGEDEVGDLFEVAFTGGAPGTQLTRLLFDTDKDRELGIDDALPSGDVPTIGDTFFDTVTGEPGDFAGVGLSIIDHTGIDSVVVTPIADGAMTLRMDFVGFDPGERLVFSIDVDEQGSRSANAVAEGNEFEDSRLVARFVADHYEQATGSSRFSDDYNEELEQTGLDLPVDEYDPPSQYMPESAEPGPVYTAAAIFAVEQTPLPITISGTVFEDVDLDNARDAGEPGLAGETLTLYELAEGTYESTGRTATTDAHGNYRFADVLPGTYRIVETQPAGYFSVAATAGTVDGVQRGMVESVDVIRDVQLSGGEDSVGNDFAEARPATLSGHVYHDADNDGAMDPGEPGIAGVSIQVQYLPSDGPAPPPQTTVTRADGSWAVDGLVPGRYRITEAQPDGYFDGLDAAGTAGGEARNPGDLIDEVLLQSGQVGEDYDFGELLPVSISGRVHADLDGDCIYDPGEELLSEVTIHLLDGSGQVIDSTQTNPAGEYSFTGMFPGVYGVREVQPDGYFDGPDQVGSAGGLPVAPDTIAEVTLPSGTDAVRYDFCEIPPVSISGYVYVDDNNNGLFDGREDPIGGVQIVLLNGDGAPTAETTVAAANGFYQFDGLRPGTYGVSEVQPDGYIDGRDTAGTAGGVAHNPGDRITGVLLPPATDGEDYNFGEWRHASISGRVHADLIQNCRVDPGEPLLDGVTIHLLDAKGNRIRTTLTDDDGMYFFDGLVPSTYGVEEVQPSGYLNGDSHLGSAGGRLLSADSIVDVVLGSSVAATGYDFCELPPGSIAGRVYVDGNENGLRDVDEKLLQGVTVYLLDSGQGVIASTTTDADGAYAFTGLAPGTYGVREVQPPEYFDGPEQIGSAAGRLSPPDAMVDVELSPGTDAVHYDFREIPAVSISGYVYIDDNGSGVRDEIEVGIAGVTVTLLDANGVSTGQTAATDVKGFYRFDDLPPGVYGVAEQQPEGYLDGRDSAGSAGGTAHNPGDRITGAKLKDAVHAKLYNFGELQPASIGGRIHADVGIQDCRVSEGEPLLQGVTVYLLDSAGRRIDKTTTNAKGEYLFDNLVPGTYGVEEIQPEQYLDGRDHVGSAGGRVDGNDRIADVPLGSGVDARDYNFCELAPASISGHVFQDGPEVVLSFGEQMPTVKSIRDGRFTADDTPIPGVTIQLRDGNGLQLLDAAGRPIQTRTDANGYYEFNKLRPGLYTVVEVQPTGFVDGIDTAGDLGGIAVNSPQEHHPELVPLAILSANNPNGDAIVSIPIGAGDAAKDYNFSEVRAESSPWFPVLTPPDPPPVAPTPAPPVPEVPAVIDWLPLLLAPQSTLSLDGSIGPDGYTWHLSVINAGRPRDERVTARLASDPFTVVSWAGVNAGLTPWMFLEEEGRPARRARFGPRDGIPVVGDFNGDGVDEIGAFLDGVWYLDLNGDGSWDDTDFWARLGDKGDLPVVGDWDGDGKDDIGIFGPAWMGDPRALAAEPGLPNVGNQVTGHFKNIPPKPEVAAVGLRSMKRFSVGALRSDLIDHVFYYGAESDRPVTGDFNGDGVATIGVFREGTWFLDVNGDGRYNAEDQQIEFGHPGDVPVVGDFNNDGVDDLGVYRGGRWLLDLNGDRRLDPGEEVRGPGGPHDKPVAGDFDGDGDDEPPVYRDQGPQPDEQASR